MWKEKERVNRFYPIKNRMWEKTILYKHLSKVMSSMIEPWANNGNGKPIRRPLGHSFILKRAYCDFIHSRLRTAPAIYGMFQIYYYKNFPRKYLQQPQRSLSHRMRK